MRTIKFKKLFDDVELPTKNSLGFDLRIHSFHKITEDGVIAQETNTFYMTGHSRVLVKMGYSIEIPEILLLSINTRTPAAIKDGLVVMDAPKIIDKTYIKELEVLLYCSTNRVILLQKGYRIATMNVLMKTEFDLQY